MARRPRPLVPTYPDAVEREYARLLLAYRKEYERLVQLHLPPVMARLRKEVSVHTPDALAQEHMDADSAKAINELFEMILGKLEKSFPDTLLKRWAQAMASKTAKVSAKNLAAQVKRATKGRKEGPVEILGILNSEKKLTPYFRNVVDQNVALIRSIPEEKIPAFKNSLNTAIMQDMPVRELSKIIRKHYAATDSKARLIARDQVGKLNGELDKYHQQVLGLKRYRWRTMKDGAVRGRYPPGRKGPDHWHLEGTIQTWAKKPIVNTKTGKRCHPKEDIQCRCYAEAVIEDLLDE